MLKNKKFNLTALTIALGATSLASVVAATSCSIQNKSKNTVQVNNPEDFATVDNGYSMYSKLTFVAPETPSGVKFAGATIVKIKTGHLFGTVAHPDAILPGYQCNGWKFKGGTHDGDPVVPSTIIDGDATIEPVMDIIGSQLSISGREDIYDGFALDLGGNLLGDSQDTKGYVYDVVSASEIVATDQIKLEAIVGNDIVTITRATTATNNTKFYVKPIHMEGFDFTGTNVTLKATLTRDGHDYTQTKEIKVRPPYYYDGSVRFSGKILDLGKAYWTSYDSDNSGEADKWVLATESEMSKEADTESSETITYYGIYDGYDHVVQIDMLRQGADTNKAKLISVYSGAEIISVIDYFLADIDLYNPTLCGGIRDIQKIGEGFLSCCTSFDQNITALCDAALQPVTIESFFLAGCTGFTNNGEEFKLPKASMIGEGFMDECTSLSGTVTIDSSVIQHIGSYFMNDCDNVTKLVIADTVTQLTYFGNNIMTNCDNLTSIVFNTADISYLEDIRSSQDQIGSFTVDNNTAAAFTTGITVGGTTSNVADILDLYPERLDNSPFRNFTNK